MRTGRRVGRHDLNRSAGIGSKEEDLTGEFLINLSTSASVRILNLVKVVVAGGSAEVISWGVGGSVAVASDDWILETLSEKNCAKSVARL